MQIQKKIKCINCGTIIEVDDFTTSKCDCGKVNVMSGKVISECNNYIDISPKLLNE